MCRKLIAAVLLGACATGALGDSIDLAFVQITNNGNLAVASQLGVNIATVDGDGSIIRFTFTNAVGVESTVSEIYFDDGDQQIGDNGKPDGGTFFNDVEIWDQANSADDGVDSDVDFVASMAHPGDLPGGNIVGFASTLALLAEARPPQSHNGLNEALDFLVLDLVLRTPGTFVWSDLVSAVRDDTFRMGFHVISIGGDDSQDGSESYVTLIIPLPSSSFLAIAGLGAIGLRRRR